MARTVYALTRHWNGRMSDVIEFTNKRKALKSCEDFKNVALVTGQKLIDINTGETLWISNGLRA